MPISEGSTQRAFRGVVRTRSDDTTKQADFEFAVTSREPVRTKTESWGGKITFTLKDSGRRRPPQWSTNFTVVVRANADLDEWEEAAQEAVTTAAVTWDQLGQGAFDATIVVWQVG
jgi:archaellum component FlaG (FlaF/FlaG flagellin family)